MATCDFITTEPNSYNENQTGPVTRAIAAMRSDQPRRGILKAAGAVLFGAIVGVPTYRTTQDLSAVAEGWIADANDLGMYILRGPDGKLWRGMAINISEERVAAQDHHWHKLNNRPRLLRAVHAAVERGVQAYA